MSIYPLGRKNLTPILTQIIDFCLDLVPKVSMRSANRAIGPGKPLGVWQDGEDPPPVRGLHALARCFEGLVPLGDEGAQPLTQPTTMESS